MRRPAKVAKPVIYRHTAHAEWGMGMIVEENPTKVYLVFEDGSRRPFLNVVRFRDLLVRVEMEDGAAEEVVARITKNGPKPESKVVDKKKKKTKLAAAQEDEEVGAVPEDEERDADEDESQEQDDE